MSELERERAEFHDVKIGDRVEVWDHGHRVRVRIVQVREGHGGMRLSVSFKRAKQGIKFATSVGSTAWSKMVPVYAIRRFKGGTRDV